MQTRHPNFQKNIKPDQPYPRWSGLLAAVLLLHLFLAACSGSTTNVPGPSSASGTSQTTLPGTEEFGLTKKELVTSIESVESRIAECMRAAGFEYVAVDYNTVRNGMVADKSLPGLSEREFIAQYGFGISTLYTGLAPQLSTESTPAKIGLGEQNVQIFNNLAPTDQVAYSHTLFGEHADATFAVAIETENFSRTGGCTRTAIEQVFSPEQLTTSYYNPLDALVNQDPRMVAARTEFTQCVGAAGFDYSDMQDIEADFRKRLDDITQGQPLDALSADAFAALETLQAEERAVAVVAMDCEVNVLDPVAGQIERELYASPPK